MVPLRILTLIVGAPTQPGVLVLEPVEKTPPGKSRVVPIWVGANEAAQIGAAINNAKLPRPTTHDLFLDAITNLDTRVDHVLINHLSGKVFHSKLVLKQGERTIELDARPTDSVSLAIRQQAPSTSPKRFSKNPRIPTFRATSTRRKRNSRFSAASLKTSPPRTSPLCSSSSDNYMNQRESERGNNRPDTSAPNPKLHASRQGAARASRQRAARERRTRKPGKQKTGLQAPCLQPDSNNKTRRKDCWF